MNINGLGGNIKLVKNSMMSEGQSICFNMFIGGISVFVPIISLFIPFFTIFIELIKYNCHETFSLVLLYSAHAYKRALDRILATFGIFYLELIIMCSRR